MTKEQLRTPEYAPWVDPLTPDKDWGTSHLPETTVSQPFLLAVEMTTVADNPREGGVWASLRIGGRDNPELTDEEIEYVTTVVRKALPQLATGKRAPTEVGS